jgi:hypothetical protein
MEPGSSLLWPQDPRYWPLSWAGSIHPTSSSPIFIKYILICSVYIQVSEVFYYLEVFRPKFYTHFSIPPCVLHVPPIFSLLFEYPREAKAKLKGPWSQRGEENSITLIIFGEECKVWSSSLWIISSTCYFLPLYFQMFSSALCLQTFFIYIFAVG